MSLDSKQVTITVSQDPKTSDLIISGDTPVSLSGNGVVVYELVAETGLGLEWVGMSFCVDEPWWKNEFLRAQLSDATHIEVFCTPNIGQPNPVWGAYVFYLTFKGTKRGVSGKMWSFDPEIDCEEPL